MLNLMNEQGVGSAQVNAVVSEAFLHVSRKRVFLNGEEI